jgi:hypothetical protein
LETHEHAEHDDEKVDRDGGPFLFAEMRDCTAQKHLGSPISLGAEYEGL